MQLSPERERLVDDCAQTDPNPMDSSESDADIQEHLGKDFSALADMYWVFFFLYSNFFCQSPWLLYSCLGSLTDI